ncbi:MULTISPECIES: hypothetical protein [Amycolatopsis]|uniref:Uncharacterized protein n=2 Tax=Amycolatopsis TaxID=1813 RepID=A0A1I4BGC6_9PSEU|nr:hypothetical protein [Amycolatopsis sacchari]SFK67922.1 hypothetical protein SAMN05421835_12869 [Amycolatopsis sacchari]
MTWVVLAAVVVLALGALVPVLLGRARRTGSADEEITARARYSQLGHHVEHPVATDDAEAAALLRRGRERWHATGAALAEARSPQEFALAARIAAEGLDHVAAAYARMGRPAPF